MAGIYNNNKDIYNIQLFDKKNLDKYVSYPYLNIFLHKYGYFTYAA